MTLTQWAIKWGVPYAAVDDLRREFGLISTDPATSSGASEGAIQNLIRLEASKKGLRLWRNNLGATMDDRGNFVRYGLCNDSKQMNKQLKSSDLIGLRPVLITPQHVGHIIGQFTAREVKRGNWQFSGSEEENAQLNFIKLVTSLGGDARFANTEGTL